MGKEQKVQGYCVRCKQKQYMKDVKKVKMKSGMMAAKGKCIVCDCNMCKILGKA